MRRSGQAAQPQSLAVGAHRTSPHNPPLYYEDYLLRYYLHTLSIYLDLLLKKPFSETSKVVGTMVARSLG